MSQSALIDQPAAVRSEDALDVAAIGKFIKQYVSGLQGELKISQFKGGASNLTYQLNYDNAVYILRCPPKGTKAKSAHDMGREFKIMQGIKPLFPFVPAMIAFCKDESVIGRDFYIMEKITGIILRGKMPAGLNLNPEQTRQLCLNVLDKLIEIHRIDINAAGLHDFNKGSGYCKRQIDGWSDRYQKAHTWNVPGGKKVINWLKAHIPAHETLCLIHNDFRFDNVVLDSDDPLKVIGVLDWEMATIGDPLMDLGNSLAYWVQADDDFLMRKMRRQPTHLPGMLTRKEAVEYYCGKTGFNPGDFTFYEVYGLFRLAVIAQQIYYRYHHKQTTNPVFKNFWLMVNYLIWRCNRVIK